MAGNSKRQGAIRKEGVKKAKVGSGGNRRQGLEPKGPTPKAVERPAHVAHKRATAAAKSEPRVEAAPKPHRAAARKPSGKSNSDIVAGRNPVVESLATGVPSEALFVQRAIDPDPRIKQALALAMAAGIQIREASRTDLDALSDGVTHQGILLEVAPYEYRDLDDVLLVGTDKTPGLVVALDGVTDPRNLGAIARSAAAFGATGMVIPERRSAGVTASAWRTSAGAIAYVPVAKVTNLTRSIEAAKKAGFTVVGLAGDADVDIRDADLGNEPVMLVIGSEGKGLGRLVAESCDIRASISISSRVESLNAAVAAGIALHAVVSGRPTN